MDNARFVLFVFFFFLSVMLWQQWQVDYGPKPEVPAAQSAINGGIPDASQATPTPDAAPQPGQAAEARAVPHQRISVKSDVVHLEIDTHGGDLRVLDLTAYPESKETPDKPVRLLSDAKEEMFVAQGGFVGGDAMAPSHKNSEWHSAATEYTLADGQDTLRVPLSWTNGQGVTVTKTYILKRGSYDIQLEQTVNNQTSADWTARQYVQLQRRDPGDKAKDQLVRTYTGGVFYTPEDKYKKISFKDMQDENLNKKSKDAWVAMIQHYFVAAWIPPAGEEYNYYTNAIGDGDYVIGAYTAPLSVGANQQKTFTAQLYAGPKLLRTLEATAPGLGLVVDYGKLTIIAEPIFWLLEQFHKIFNNWGVAIIFVTLTLKALFFRLSASSYKSMANMRKLQPKLQELKEQYGNNKQEMNMKMMEMYRKEKVNPLGGCLPILVQIPVFIALYWVLAESVEMRQAPFALWLTDLSSKDPYFILPAIMGVSMFIQQKLSPPPNDPMQAKIMQFFPVMFTGFFAFFPSGLVLYWVVNNLLSILQQWYINKVIIGESGLAKT